MTALTDLTQNLIHAAAIPGGNATDASQALCQWLHAHPDRADDLDLSLQKTLRDARQFDALRSLAECLGGLGRHDPTVRLSLAQSLIDTDAPSTAIDVLHRVAGTSSLSKKDKVQTHGQLGRAFKDLFLRTNAGDKQRRAEVLNLAIENYETAFSNSGKSDIWSGENLLALLTKAKAEKTGIRSLIDPDSIADRIEKSVKRVPKKKRAYWHWASLSVVAISRNDWATANTAMANAVKAEGISPFALEGTIRQLKLMWGAEDNATIGAGLLVPLQARKLQLSKGAVRLSPNEMQSARAIPEDQFERIFGTEGPRTYAWMQKFIASGLSVGLISEKLGSGVGTCFVVDGADFHDSLKGERLVLTNDHVVSPHPEAYTSNPPLRVNKADVSFEIFSRKQGECRIDARDIVWSSGAQDHDACLIRLRKDMPADLDPLPITDLVPIVDETAPEGVYVIGHPGGRGLSYSMQNNELLDHDCKTTGDAAPRHIHYVTPTEPGSSGSPAMNADLDIIGLHHAGAKYMQRLNGKDGTYPANEAVWIKSICDAARHDIAKGRTRWEPS